MTNSERAKEYRKNNKKLKKTSSSSQNRTYTNSERVKRLRLPKKIGLDTFEKDLKSMGKMVQNLGSNWQTQETMSRFKPQVEAMRTRIKDYQEYQELFGGADISNIANAYDSVLNNWDSLSEVYGQYKNADAYSAAKKESELSSKFRVKTGTDEKTGEDTYRGLTYDEVQEYLKKYKPDSDEYKFLSSYMGYTDLRDFDKAIENTHVLPEWYDNAKKNYENWKIPQSGTLNEEETKKRGVITYYTSDDQRKAEQQREEYFKNLSGGIPYEELEKAVKESDKSKYLEKLKTLRNVWALDNTFDLFKDVMENEDFAKKSQYWDGHTFAIDNASTAEAVASDNDGLTMYYDKEGGKYYVTSDPLYEFINNKNNAREAIPKAAVGESIYGGEGDDYLEKGYDQLTEDEVAVFNYIDATQGRKAAAEFLDKMAVTLTKRKYEEETKKVEEFADSGFLAGVGTSIASIAGNFYGSIGNAVASLDEWWNDKEYNPYDPLRSVSNLSSDARGYVSENIAEATEGFELFGQNIPSFLYDTGMSMADTVAGSAMLGPGYSVIAGTNSFQQTAKELVEAGEDADTVFKTALVSGMAEVVFEYVSIDKLLKIDNVDSLGNVIKSALKQAGVEATEEFLTEATNIWADVLIRGDSSEVSTMREELKAKGYSDEEIDAEIREYVAGRLGKAAAGGGLSGLGLGGVQSYGSYSKNKSIGKGIKSNEKTADMLDIAGLTPKESDAYKAYTKYAQKGYDADNISNARLGNLYSLTNEGARNTLSSKKTSDGEKIEAIKTLSKLSKVGTVNEAAKISKELTKNGVAEENSVNASGEKIDIAGIKLGKDTKVITAEGKEISISDITLTQKDADLLSHAQLMNESVANLFINQYDGQTDVSEYADSFNLVMEYAKHDFTQDTILENKGVLSNEQVSAIYGATVINQYKAKQNAIDELNAKHGKAFTVQGKIDDSVIDYDNTGAEGKVAWNSLNSSQRKAITFMKGIAKGTGMNLSLISNGMELGINGAFEIRDNTIVLDIYAGMDKVGGTDFSDSIIPTASHEITHWAKEKAPALYRKIDEFVFKSLMESSGLSEADILNQRRMQLEKNHPNEKISDETVRDEVIARACEDMLAMSEEGKKIFESLSESEQKTFVDKIKDIIQNLKNWINDLLSQYKSNSVEAIELRKYQDKLNELSKMWDEMLRQAIQANQSLQKEGITGEALAKKVTGKTTNENVQEMARGNNPNIAFYTETQYNNFGWVRYNDVLSAEEYSTLLSRYADYKHNKDHYPTTRFGEAVIFSFDYPNILMYVKGTIRSPQITKILKIDPTIPDTIQIDIQKEILSNERSNLSIPWENVTFVFGEGSIDIYKKRDFSSFQEYKRRRERELSEEDNSSNRNKQDRKRVSDQSKTVSKLKDNEIKRSDRDTLGNTLTEAQQSYFAESKVRDENGNLKVMYHGTPNATFTKFRSGTYFTEHKWYADNYQNQGASSLSYKKTADKPDTYAVYLDIKKPFDTRNKKERDIFYKEYYQQWGTGTDLMESGLPDWLDGQDLQEFLEEKGYDYDGLILDEGATGGYGEEVTSRGLSYVVFNPEQVKSVENKNPTKDADYRFSDRENRLQELQTEYTQLEKEAEALKKSEEYLNFLDSISLLQGEELDNAIKEYGEWTRKSGLYDKSKRMSEIIGEQKDIRAALDNEKELSRDAYMKSIENLTEKEKMDFVNKAVKRFGTTNRLSLASYLMLNGKMLDFSEGQGYRVQDHREISEILDMPETTEYSDGLIAFMNMGNIRLQTYGIDISQAPNQAQKSALRDIISKVMRDNDEFSVDFSKANGYTDGSVTYPKGTATTKILSDIDNYFKTGVVPEYESSIAEFRYSDRDTIYMEAVNNGDMETAQRMVDEVAKSSGYNTPKLYHGSGTFGFTKFRSGMIYATASSGVAMGYNRGQGLGRIRNASKRYIQNDGTIDTAIENAKNVLGATYSRLTDKSKNDIISNANEIFNDISTKIGELDESINRKESDAFWDYIYSKYGEEKANEFVNVYQGLAYMLSGEMSAEEILENNEWFKYDIERSHERKQIFRDFFTEEYNKIKGTSLYPFFSYLNGYEFGDALIDLEYGINRLADGREILITERGSIAYLEEVIESIEAVKDVGIYQLYGNMGNNPLVIDEGKVFWDAIPFEGKYRSTDYIANWAKENGYTSVLFKTVLDPSSNGSVNEYADEYVFFDSEQIKSADPITYDDKGNVIPLSERFNMDNDDIRYSNRDSEGNELSKEQQDFFANSKVRDSEGNLLVCYHGTDAKFTVFDKSKINSSNGAFYGKGFYFSNSKSAANQYGNNVYEYYLNITNPLYLDDENWVYDLGIEKKKESLRVIDAKLEETRKGFYTIHYKDSSSPNTWKSLDRITKPQIDEYGVYGFVERRINPKPSILPRDVKDIAYLAQEKGYDGIIGNGTNITDFGTVEYVVFDENQIKSTSNINPTSNPDIRYSDRDNVSVYDTMGETDRLIKENTQLKEDVERLKERLALEKQITHGNYFNKNQLDAVAGHIRKLANSNYNKKDLVTLLNGIYSYIATSKDLNWQDLFSQCYDVASMVLGEARPVTVTNDYLKMILKDIRSRTISVNEQQIQNAKYKLGDKWRNAFFNRVKISESGISLDSQWSEWAATYPDIFDAEISDADQLVELYDIYDNLKEASEIVVEYDLEEQTRWLAREIYNQYWNVSPIRTTAEKYDKQIKLLNYKHREAINKLRDNYEDRLKSQHKADRQKAIKLVKEIRDSKDKEIAEVKQRSKARMEAYKDNAARKTKIQSITGKALTLNEWLLKNSKEKHIHESLKGPVANLLQAIDFSSQQLLGMRGGDNKGTPTRKDISLQKALSQVKDMMLDASVGKEELIDLYGHDLDEDIKSMVESVDNIMRTVGDNAFILNKMTLNDLNTLDNMLKTIKQAVTKMNQFHSVHHAKGIASLGHKGIEYAEKLGNEKAYVEKSMKAGANKMLKWSMANPYYAFKRFGEAGKKIFEAFQDGWDKLSFNAKKIIDFTEKAYKTKEVKDWEGEIKSFNVRLPATELEKSDPNYKPKYQKVKMTTAQVMYLYLLNKRAAAKGHLLGGGIVVSNIETKKNQVISQPEGVLLEQGEINKIIQSLTKRQIEVANALSWFMNTVCSDWGNEISMARFGYKAFEETDYVPMQVDKDEISTADPAEKNNSLFKLLNMPFTKSLTEGANNRLVISSLFDVFAQHTSDMAKYNALALPVLDAFKWYNYKEIEYVGDEAKVRNTVKKSIGKAFGKEGQKYITTFLEDINGQNSLSRDTLSVRFFKNAKIASVGMNLRVILLQPTSYFRASANIDNKYLVKALAHKPKTEYAEKYCGMALWKSLGYYDTNIQRGLAEQIKHKETRYDKMVEWSMKGAGEADRLTLGYLWNAAELEIRETRKDLKIGSEEFFLEVGKRLRDIIYSTQVVDSIVTRSEFMRSPDGKDKILSMFASEPTLAYNILQDAYIQTGLDARELGSKKKALKKNGKMIGRVITAYTVTNAVAALVESGFDALRDDDEEEMDIAEFLKLYLSNFASDMSIVGKIPYLKDGISILQGYSPSRTDVQWMQSAYYTLLGISKHLKGEGNPETTIKNGIKTSSYLSGLPFYNAYRDAKAILNKLDILTEEDLEEIFDD